MEILTGVGMIFTIEDSGINATKRGGRGLNKKKNRQQCFCLEVWSRAVVAFLFICG
jgi:hypothetical protein